MEYKRNDRKKHRKCEKKEKLARYSIIIHILQETIYTFQKAKKDYPILDSNELKQAEAEILVALTIISELVNKNALLMENTAR